jgi:hypothetical protein
VRADAAQATGRPAPRERAQRVAARASAPRGARAPVWAPGLVDGSVYGSNLLEKMLEGPRPALVPNSETNSVSPVVGLTRSAKPT